MNGKAVALVVVIAAGAGAGGYYYYSQRGAPTASAPTQQAPAAAPALTLAATVPEFKLADREGQLRSLNDWQGKSLIVNFWATWCAPCRREIPLLQQIARDRSADGFQVVGIAVDFRDKVLEYADQMKIEYPLLIGEQDALDAATAFGVEAVGFPFTIFSDAQGRVIVAHTGELNAAEAALILDLVAEVNAGKIEPAEARTEIAARLPALQQESADKSAG